MEELLLKIIHHLTEQMPELALIDEDYGQLENLQDENTQMYPIVFPCVLVDAPRVSWTDIAGLSQKGTATLRVRLCIDCYHDTHHTSHTTAHIAERAQMADTLHKAMQGLAPMDESPLRRTMSEFYTARHGIKVYEHHYECTVTSIVPQTAKKTSARPRVVLSLADGTR